MTKEERRVYDKQRKPRFASKEERTLYFKTWAKNNKDKVKGYNDSRYVNRYEMRRDEYLKRKYGITHAEYNKLFEQQKGKCEICKTHQSELKARLSVDHDHQTGRVRGLLCYNCNSTLGHAKDSIDILQSSIRYLKK